MGWSMFGFFCTNKFKHLEWRVSSFPSLFYIIPLSTLVYVRWYLARFRVPFFANVWLWRFNLDVFISHCFMWNTLYLLFFPAETIRDAFPCEKKELFIGRCGEMSWFFFLENDKKEHFWGKNCVPPIFCIPPRNSELSLGTLLCKSGHIWCGGGAAAEDPRDHVLLKPGSCRKIAHGSAICHKKKRWVAVKSEEAYVRVSCTRKTFYSGPVDLQAPFVQYLRKEDWHLSGGGGWGESVDCAKKGDFLIRTSFQGYPIAMIQQKV